MAPEPPSSQKPPVGGRAKERWSNLSRASKWVVAVVLAAAIGAPVGTLSTALSTGWLISDDGSENSATSTEEETIFDDSFTTAGAKRWKDDADTDETGGQYTDDGAYQISAERAMDRWGVLAWPKPVEENVHMTVKAHRVDGGTATDGYGYGLFCRADGQANLYAFTIWANHATIEKRIEGQGTLNMGTNDRFTAAAEGDTEKELQAVCTTISEGSVDLQFWVDNDLILRRTDDDDPHANGNFGLFAALGQGKGNIGDTLVVRFDDFVVTGTAGTPSR
jgi:hypothetical protein